MQIFDNLKLVRCPRSLDLTLVTLPSMSLIPFAPFGGDDVGIGEIDAVFEAGFVTSANLECLRYGFVHPAQKSEILFVRLS